MSAILAILLMLSAVVFIPHAFAQVPADAIQANPLSINWTYPTHGPGEVFTAYADVVNVQGLFAYQIGFYFDPTALKVNSVAEGGFLSNNGADMLLAFPGSIDNVAGVVKTYGWTLVDPALAKSGTGHLLTVQFQILTTFSGTYPGTPVTMMHFTETPLDPAQLLLVYLDGVSDISPLPQNLFDGTFDLTQTATPTTAAFTITPPPPNYVGDTLTFDASASKGQTIGPGTFATIIDYAWDFGDGTPIEHDAVATTTHSYAAAGPYTITLTVTDNGPTPNTAPASHSVNILVRPTGCVLDAYTQNWRYIDPFTYTGVLQGKGPNLPAEMFRPGDLVRIYVNTIYNGDPVAYQFVAVQVLDANGTTVLAGNILTDAGGLGFMDFRIPWPQNVNSPFPIFGMWTVIVTWEVGSNNVGIPPGSITQNDTLTFNVGWGVWSSDLTTDFAAYFKGDTVNVTYKLHNDYGIPINVLNTVTLYDDLMVPIAFTFVEQMFNPGVTSVTETLKIPVWAFTGTGTVKANEYSTFPSANGIAFGPEQLAVFAIKHTFNPVDP